MYEAARGEFFKRDRLSANSHTSVLGRVVLFAIFEKDGKEKCCTFCNSTRTVLSKVLRIATCSHCALILYYTSLYYSVLFCTILYYSLLFLIILCSTILYHSLLFFIILYYALLLFTILFYYLLFFTRL